MRKLAIAFLIATLPLTTAGSCGKTKVCEPAAVRKDSYRAERWWLCNLDGTKEDPIDGPRPESDPIKAAQTSDPEKPAE